MSAGALVYTDCVSASCYDIKLSDYENPLMLEFWGMWSNPSLLNLVDPLWPGVVAHDRVLYMVQIEQFEI